MPKVARNSISLNLVNCLESLRYDTERSNPPSSFDRKEETKREGMNRHVGADESITAVISCSCF